MRNLKLAGVALIALLAAPATAQPEQAPTDQVIVRGNAVTRMEIERILNADNVDTGRLTPRQVADTIRAIPRGRAPGDFWTAYQAHVRAWQAMATAFERLERLANAKPSLQADAMADLAEAQAGIESTFDEVERIAVRYGVAMPVPPGTPLPTT